MKKFIMGLLMAAGVSSATWAADKPAFPGGEEALGKYISENLKYPEAAKANGVEGIVNVEFMVRPTAASAL